MTWISLLLANAVPAIRMIRAAASKE